MRNNKALADESLQLKKITEKVLLVDDNENVLSSLKRQFRKQFKIDSANSGLTALECIKNNGPYAVVVSDMQMPHMDGIEFLSKVREISDKTIRIMLTGNANMEVAINGINKGNLFRFLTKPIANELLFNAIMDGLKQYRLLAEHQQLFNINKKQNELLTELNQNLENKVQLRTADLNKANETLKKQNIEVIMTFSKMIELRTGIEKGHAKYIAQKASLLGKNMGMNKTDVQDTLIAGLLLQIGKMSLAEKLLTRPFFLLDKLDRQDYLKHAVEGQLLLTGLDHLKQPAKYIRHQYERYNGSGLPDRLEGKEIPLASRILSVIQNYIANTDGVITGKKMLGSEARDILIKNKGRVYDPNVVDEFIRLIGSSQTIQKYVNVQWFDLQVGMLIDKLYCKDALFCKNTVVTMELIKEIKQLRKEAGDHIQITIKVRNG
ncbi:MAG: response regulator [Pseudomonadota bacterium]